MDGERPAWTPLQARLERLHRERLKLPKKTAPLRKGGDRVAAAMLAGRPLPLSYLQTAKPEQGAAIPPATLRKLDAALQKIADDKKAPPAEKTRWSFIPRYGMVVRFPIGGEVQFGRVLDWGPGGLSVATKKGDAKVTWADATPVSDEELVKYHEQHEQAQEDAGVRLSRWGWDDFRTGMPVRIAGPGGEGSFQGKIVLLDPKGQFIVVRCVVIDAESRTVQTGYVAAMPSQVLAVPDESGELPAP